MLVRFLCVVMVLVCFAYTQDADDANIESFTPNPNGIVLKNTQEISVESTKNNPFIQMKDEQQMRSLRDSVYGHVGFFGKSNMLGKNDDSYGVFSGSLGLMYDFLDIHLGVGIYGTTSFMDYPNHNARQYVQSKFVTNNAYIQYEVQNFFEIIAGRYRANRSWLNHFVQGVGVDASYDWITVWGEWVDEQAIVSREYMSDFDIYKNYYNREFLTAAGVEFNAFGLEIAPYYYLMNKYFWAAGSKIELNIDINASWNTTTTLHYAFLHAKHDTLSRNVRNQSMLANDDGQILWVEESLRYKNDNHSISFGGGFVRVWDSYFELANIGNISRFETDSYYGFNGIESDGIYNGSNATNMFDKNARTIYGFAGYSWNDELFVLLLGRYSKSDVKQDLYSIGAKYKIMEGLYVGGVGAYMQENKTNMSFVKGFIEFVI